MGKAICNVAQSSVREENSERSPQISQILYGESVELLEKKDGFAKVNFLQTEMGWIDERHLQEISDEDFANRNTSILTENFKVIDLQKGKCLLSIGSEIETTEKNTPNNCTGEEIAKTALEFLNVPHLAGGRSFFGVDAANFVQLVFKIHGIFLPKNLEEMSKIGDSLFFVGESEAGDIAFFSNAEGEMIHAGIMLNNFELIHVDEKVRIDTIDSTGIYSKEQRKHTYLLRVVQRIL
jgi:hypothetical protein